MPGFLFDLDGTLIDIAAAQRLNVSIQKHWSSATAYGTCWLLAAPAVSGSGCFPAATARTNSTGPALIASGPCGPARASG